MIVSFTGPKQSGKDTCARMLGDSMGNCEYRAFAGPIRRMVQIMFGWTDYHFQSPTKEEIDPAWGVSPRQAMQYIGTEVGQFGFSKTFPQFGETTGRELWARRLLQERDITKHLIITDMRFPHEYYAVKHYAFENNEPYFNVLVERPNTKDDEDRHFSETSYNHIPVDFLIVNNDGLDKLRENVEDIVVGINAKKELQ